MKTQLLFCSIFAFLFLFILSCQKPDYPNNTIKNQETVFRGFWVEGEFDGVFRVMEQLQDDVVFIHENNDKVELPDCTFSYQSCLKQGESIFGGDFDYRDGICIEFINLYNGACIDEWGNFPSLFYPKSMEYTSSLNSPGVSISYNDHESKKSWNTHLGPQDNSNFRITESWSKEFDFDGLSYQKIKGEFSCILYNNQGEKMEVTNGTFYLLYSPVQ